MEQQTIFKEWQSNKKYQAWRKTANGKAVFEAAKNVILRLKENGKRAGIRDAWSYVRVNYWLGKDKDGYKVNNDYSCLAAYELEETIPELAGYFEHRKKNKEKLK